MKPRNIKNRKLVFVFFMTAMLPFVSSAQQKKVLLQLELSPSARVVTNGDADAGFGGTIKFMLIDNHLSKKGIEKKVKPFVTLALDYGSYCQKFKDHDYGSGSVYNYRSFLLSSGVGILAKKFFFELQFGVGAMDDSPCISLGAEAGFFLKNFTFSAFHTSTSDIIWGDVFRIYGLKVGYRLQLNRKE